MPTDIEIARAAHKRPIIEIGGTLGIPPEGLIPYGHDKAKITAATIDSLADRPDGWLSGSAEDNDTGRVRRSLLIDRLLARGHEIVRYTLLLEPTIPTLSGRDDQTTTTNWNDVHPVDRFRQRYILW